MTRKKDGRARAEGGEPRDLCEADRFTYCGLFTDHAGDPHSAFTTGARVRRRPRGKAPIPKEGADMGTARLLLLAAWAFAAVARAEEPPVTISVPRLSMEVGLKLARAAIEACRKENVNVAVTVVDRGGHPQVVLRDTLAMDLTLVVSRQKAYTAMSFNAPTSELESRFKGAYSVPKLETLVISAGGLPITGGGRILGGVGVSGSPSGETDEKCAQAGIDAVRFDLEGA